MPLTPLQRKAAFAHAVTMHETTRANAALELGFSRTHLDSCISGARIPGATLRAKLAGYCGVAEAEFWGELVSVAKAS